MTRERVPYSRVYWSVNDDEKFDGIREDMGHMGSWLTLLVQADMSYPAPPFVPPTVPRRSLKALSDANLIELLSGKRFRVVGLASERERRSRSLDAPNRSPNRDPDADTVVDEAVDEDETSKAVAVAPDADDPADAWWLISGRYPSQRALAWMDDLTGQFGGKSVTAAIVRAYQEKPDGALGRASDALRAEARRLDRQEREDERQRLAEKRARPRPMTGPDAELRAVLEAKYAAQYGKGPYDPEKAA